MPSSIWTGYKDGSIGKSVELQGDYVVKEMKNKYIVSLIGRKTFRTALLSNGMSLKIPHVQKRS